MVAEKKAANEEYFMTRENCTKFKSQGPHRAPWDIATAVWTCALLGGPWLCRRLGRSVPRESCLQARPNPPALSSAGSPPPGAWPCAPRPPPRASPVGLCVARPPAVAFVSSAARALARPPRIAPRLPVRRLPGPAGAAVALARRLGGRAGKRSFLSAPEAESPRSRHRWV